MSSDYVVFKIVFIIESAAVRYDSLVYLLGSYFLIDSCESSVWLILYSSVHIIDMHDVLSYYTSIIGVRSFWP